MRDGRPTSRTALSGSRGSVRVSSAGSVRGKGSGARGGGVGSRPVRNEAFFQQSTGGGVGGAEAKVRRAFERCAEGGVLNLSDQGLTGDLPNSVCAFQDEAWAENWWEQCQVQKVDLSHNELERIPPEIGRLCDCSIFVAVSNRFEILPSELFSELPLKQLNLKQNRIRELPGSAVAKASQLVELVLSENRLSALPHELFELESLQVLDAADNKLNVLPDGQWACKRLVRLDLSRNALGPGLPGDSLRCCNDLRQLSVSANQLEDVGQMFAINPSHGWRTSLVSLDLSNNKLQASLTVSGLDALDTLAVTSNQIRALRLQGRFPKLSTVLGQSNAISEFPAGLLHDSSPTLCTLDLSNNGLTSIPPVLGMSQNLKRISLLGNPLRAIRTELLNGSAENLKKYLRSRIEGVSEQVIDGVKDVSDPLAIELRDAAASHELRLEARGLQRLPSLPEGLQVLRIPGNSVTADSLEIALGLCSVSGEDRGVPCTDLVRLDASRNSLGVTGSSSFPPVTGLVPRLLAGLPCLQDLDLGANRLVSAGTSDDWGRFSWASSQGGTPSRLTRLDLSGNSLGSLPSELFAACPTLGELRLKRNVISSLESFVAAAPPAPVGRSLYYLDLEENRLACVPPWLPSALPCLHTFLLANNDLGPSLPAELGFWESVQTISLAGNPLRSLRQALSAKTWAPVARCLRDRLPSGAPEVAPLPSQRGARVAVVHTPAAASAVAAPAAEEKPPLARGGLSAATASTDAGGERILRLRREVATLEQELASGGLSRARQSSLNHTLRMRRGEVLQAEREAARRAAAAEGRDPG
eukprot:TRINITY_DN50922_c0_g1_i1.p1 TRINITY_DN50922_c0_g1~~TRINITY_DN50922_c0_g1_i1.p1  ORF type:complete len:813 (+),score=72.56 TRINITY_DN50922_c0_g1_i1:99-2537(+)